MTTAPSPASTKPATPLNTDVTGMTRLGLWVLAVGFGGFMLWAGFAPLDQGIPGSGTVVVSGERKVVQSLVSGRIDAILVQEGDRVEKNQPLLRLNSIQAQSQLDTALGQWITARATEARLSAERAGLGAVTWPDDLLARNGDPRATAAMALQAQLFQTRRNELDVRRRLIKNELASLKGQIDGLTEVRRHQEARLASQDKELASYNALVKQGFISSNRVYEAERDKGELSVDLASTITNLGRLQQAIQENTLKDLQIGQTFRSEVEAQLASVSAEVSTLSERIRALEFELSNTTIMAPTGGQIMAPTVHTIGGVVQAGQRLMDIVPLQTAWQIKARFPIMAADRLKPGLPVSIRFSTLQRVATPVLTGVIDTVSADQVVDEISRTPYYQAMIKPDAKLVAELKQAGLEIKPGMDAEVMASTGERTLLNYLLKPVSDSMSGALTEE